MVRQCRISCGSPPMWSVCSWEMRMPSSRSSPASASASRRSVSLLPSPASTSRRVRWVSSNVALPELPDARIVTRKAIASPRPGGARRTGFVRTSPQASCEDNGKLQPPRQPGESLRFSPADRPSPSPCGSQWIANLMSRLRAIHLESMLGSYVADRSEHRSHTVGRTKNIQPEFCPGRILRELASKEREVCRRILVDDRLDLIAKETNVQIDRRTPVPL